MSIPTEFNIQQVHNLMESYEAAEFDSDVVNSLKRILDAVPIFLGRIGSDAYIDLNVTANDDTLYTYPGSLEYEYDENGDLREPPVRRTLDQNSTSDALFIRMLQAPENSENLFAFVIPNVYYVDEESGFKLKVSSLPNGNYTVVFSSNPPELIQNTLGALAIVDSRTTGRSKFVSEQVASVKENIQEAAEYFVNNIDFSVEGDSTDDFKQDMIDYSNSLIDIEGKLEDALYNSPEAFEFFSKSITEQIETNHDKMIEIIEHEPDDIQVIFSNNADFISKMFSYLPDSKVVNDVIKTVRKINALSMTITAATDKIYFVVQQSEVETDPPRTQEEKESFLNSSLIPLMLKRDSIVNAYQKAIRHLWNMVNMSTEIIPFFPNVMWKSNNIFKVTEAGLPDKELLVAAAILEMQDEKYLNPILLGQILSKQQQDIVYTNLYNSVDRFTPEELKNIFSHFFEANLEADDTDPVASAVERYTNKLDAKIKIDNYFTPSQLKDSDVLTTIAALGGFHGLGSTEYDILAETIAETVISGSKIGVQAAKSTGTKNLLKGAAKGAGRLLKVFSAISITALIVLIYTFAKIISAFIESLCPKDKPTESPLLCSWVLEPIRNVADAVAEGIEDAVESAVKLGTKIIKENIPDSWSTALTIGVCGAVGIGLFALYRYLVPKSPITAPALPSAPPPTEPFSAPLEIAYEDIEAEPLLDVDEFEGEPSSTDLVSPLPNPVVRRRYR